MNNQTLVASTSAASGPGAIRHLWQADKPHDLRLLARPQYQGAVLSLLRVQQRTYA